MTTGHLPLENVKARSKLKGICHQKFLVGWILSWLKKSRGDFRQKKCIFVKACAATSDSARYFNRGLQNVRPVMQPPEQTYTFVIIYFLLAAFAVLAYNIACFGFESTLYVLFAFLITAYVEHLMCQHVNSIYGIFLDFFFSFCSTKTASVFVAWLR